VPRLSVGSFPPCSTTRCAKLTGLVESAGKGNPATQPPPPQAARGYKWESRWGGGTYLKLKDSNAAVGVLDCATGKALKRADRQTDKQTDFPRIIVRYRPNGQHRVITNNLSKAHVTRDSSGPATLAINVLLQQ